jgi:putative addiction module component (TIGR02574 family)
MTAITEKVLDEALALPVDERISLVDQLIASLNLPTHGEVDRLWAEEAERRLAQIERGEVELIPGEKVFAEIRAKYRR